MVARWSTSAADRDGVGRSIEVGCDVLETCTFQASRRRLEEWGLAEHTFELNRSAAALARRLADEYSTASKPRWVAGSIGPTGFLPGADDPVLSNITYDELAELFREQAAALIEGGADFLIVETAQDILELKAAIAGIRRYFAQSGRRVPIQAQPTLDTSGRMLLGTDVLAALTILQGLNVDVVFEALTQIREAGLAVLLVEQRAQRTVALADRSYVLANGELRLTLGPEDAGDTDRLVAAYLA